MAATGIARQLSLFPKISHEVGTAALGQSTPRGSQLQLMGLYNNPSLYLYMKVVGHGPMVYVSATELHACLFVLAQQWLLAACDRVLWHYWPGMQPGCMRQASAEFLFTVMWKMQPLQAEQMNKMQSATCVKGLYLL